MKKLFMLLLFSFASFFSLSSFNNDLFGALLKKDLETMRAILKDPQKIAELSYPILSSHQIFRYNTSLRHQRYNNLTIFHLAVLINNLRGLEILLDHAPHLIDITDNFQGSPLSTACLAKNVKAAELLLDRGANIHHILSDPRYPSDKRTPLLIACYENCPALVKLLLDRGACLRDVNPGLLEDGENVISATVKGGLMKGSILDTQEILETVCSYASREEYDFLLKGKINPFLQQQEHNKEFKRYRAVLQNKKESFEQLGFSEIQSRMLLEKQDHLIKAIEQASQAHYKDDEMFRTMKVKKYSKGKNIVLVLNGRTIGLNSK